MPPTGGAAESAYAADAVSDPPTFRMQRGDGKCLSRNMVGESSEATVTCYLLAHYPTQEAVMIESRVSDRLRAKSTEASPEAFDHAIELIVAGFKYWQSSYRSIAR